MSDFPAYAAGFGFGVAAAILFCMWVDRKTHGEWMAICDKHEAFERKLLAEIERLKALQDPADWWKDN